jgi:hypothetical protein
VVYGRLAAKQTVRKWMKDPSFREDGEKRRSRYAGMEY